MSTLKGFSVTVYAASCQSGLKSANALELAGHDRFLVKDQLLRADIHDAAMLVGSAFYLSVETLDVQLMALCSLLQAGKSGEAVWL